MDLADMLLLKVFLFVYLLNHTEGECGVFTDKPHKLVLTAAEEQNLAR